MPSINGSAHQMVVRLGVRFVAWSITVSGLLTTKIVTVNLLSVGITTTKSSIWRIAKSGMLTTGTANWQLPMLVSNGVKMRHHLG